MAWWVQSAPMFKHISLQVYLALVTLLNYIWVNPSILYHRNNNGLSIELCFGLLGVKSAFWSISNNTLKTARWSIIEQEFLSTSCFVLNKYNLSQKNNTLGFSLMWHLVASTAQVSKSSCSFLTLSTESTTDFTKS